MKKKYSVNDAIKFLNLIKNQKQNLDCFNVFYSLNEQEDVEKIHVNFTVNIKNM